MATNQNLTTFVVWAPDCADPGALERRLTVRPVHLDRALQLHKGGIIRIGGALLSPDSAPGDGKLCGSCFIVQAESLEAARKLVEADVYYTAGVRDKEKLQILPIALATALPAVPT